MDAPLAREKIHLERKIQTNHRWRPLKDPGGFRLQLCARGERDSEVKVSVPHGKDAFEKVPYVRDEGMKLVFERLFEHRRELERFAGCRLCDMRLLRELEGSGFVNRLYGSKQ
jgi:hypothetical protein